MRKLCLLLLFAAITTMSFAQVTWNIRGGVNLSNWYGENMNEKTKTGYKIGGGMEYALSPLVSVQTSLFLSSKGVKAISHSDYRNDVDVTVNQVYLELPVMVALRMPMSKKINLVLSAGPYFAYGIAGKISEDYHSNYETDGTDTFSRENLDRLDAGIDCGIAFEFGKVILGFDGQFGLMNISSKPNAPKNGNFSVVLGLNF